MKYNYDRPTLKALYWFVCKEDLLRIYDFLVKKYGKDCIKIRLVVLSGNNKEYDTIAELENEIDVIKRNKETIKEIYISGSSNDNDGRTHIWLDINFELGSASFSIIGSDDSGSKKDFVDGAYEEMCRIFKSFEVTDEALIEKMQKNWKINSWHDEIIIEDLDSIKKNKLEEEIIIEPNKNSTINKNKFLKILYDPWCITIAGGFLVGGLLWLVLSYLP